MELVLNEAIDGFLKLEIDMCLAKVNLDQLYLNGSDLNIEIYREELNHYRDFLFYAQTAMHFLKDTSDSFEKMKLESLKRLSIKKGIL